MNIEQSIANNENLLVKLSGEMDAQGCVTIRSELERIIEQLNTHILIDLSEVSFIDSSGIGAIVFLFKRLKQQNRSLELMGVQGQPQELMKLLRMDSAITIQYTSEQEEMQCAL